jgi:hypothetical protein
VGHIAVFGDLFDLPDRARELLGDVRVSAFVQRSRLAACEGIDGAHAIFVLPDDASAEEWADVVRTVHASHPITHAAALVDHLARAAAAALAGIGVRFHAPETMANICDKAAMRRSLDRQQLYPVPYRVVHDLPSAMSAVAELGTPCVFKPVSGTASSGVTIVRDAEDIRTAYAEASPNGSDVLVERFLVGKQYSVEAMSEEGEHVVLAVTRKYSDAQTLVELGHVMPAPITDSQREAIARCAVEVLDAVGLAYGPSHTEIVLGTDGPTPIETHARVGGDDLWLMVHAATGVDLDAVQPDQILGRRVLNDVRATLAGPIPERQYQAVWFGATRTKGESAGLVIPESVRAIEHVVVTALRGEGDAIMPLASSNDRLFKVRATGTSAFEALELARGAAAAVAAASGLPVEFADLGATI